MKGKAIACTALLLIIVLLSSRPPVLNAQTGTGYSVKIIRVTQIGGWGIVAVNDTLTVTNNAAAALGDIPIGLPRNVTSGLRYLAAVDDQNRVLSIERDLDPADTTYWYRVSFARSLAYNETYSFTVVSLFMGLVSPKGTGFAFEFVMNPVLRVKTTSEDMTILAVEDTTFMLPEGSGLTVSEEGGRVKLSGSLAPIDPYVTVPIVLDMTSPNQYIVRVPNVSREITFDSDGKIHVSDTYDFENLAGAISTIPVRLPANSSNVMAYDHIGALWDTPSQGRDLTISPRYSGGIGSNRTFTFTLKYEVDPRAYVKEEQWWGVYSFRFSLLSDVRNWIVEKLETTVSLPEGLKVKKMTPSLSSGSDTLFLRKYSYATSEVTQYTDLTLDVDYSYSPFWSSTPLLAWVGIVELIAAAIVVFSSMRKPTAVKIPVPAEKLKQFVQLYDGRTAIRLELDRMADDLTRGALNKHEYRRRRKTAEVRLDEIDKALQPLRQELKELHPRYGEIIVRMERAEGDIDANRLGAEHFRSQYRAGKISKEAYETALRDINRRVDKAKEVIETNLVTLREEAR